MELESPNVDEASPKSRKKLFLILAGVLVLVVAIAVGAIFWSEEPKDLTRPWPGDSNKYEGMSEFEAERVLNEICASVPVTILPPIEEKVDLEEVEVAEILPDVKRFPLLVQPLPNTFSVEIASSPEKASADGESYNRWLVEVANSFNNSHFVQNGQPVSVAVRSLPSGIAMDYIASGKYYPDAFTPSNSIWGDALKSKRVPHKLLAEKLVGNVAGIVIENSKYDDFIEKYQEVSVTSVVKAVSQGSFVMGYANPLISSTGANFLMSLLLSVNPQNPLSEEALAEFSKFQDNVPFVAFTTLQMTEAANSGIFDGFVYEYQQYYNSLDLKNKYAFTPFGVRHDSPVYAIGSLEKAKLELLTMFISFCRFPEAQSLAAKYGFNKYDEYKGLAVKGQLLTQAQEVFKEKKSGDREIMAVFVADLSGSMQGAPLRFLKRSLIQGAKSISFSNYVGLVQFSDQVQIAMPMGKFDLAQRAIFTGAVNHMSAGGGAAMFDGVAVAAKMLQEAKQGHPTAKLMIIVITDGETLEGHNFNEIAPVMRGLRIPVYTISYNARLKGLKEVSAINAAASFEADTEDIVYKMRGFFNAEM
jgi:Ca-activated chloride channel family protein